MGLFGKLKESLTKTRKEFVDKMETLVVGHKDIDEDLFEELEEIMIEADMGADVAFELVDKLREEIKKRKIREASKVRPLLQELIQDILDQDTVSLELDTGKPAVIMVAGVNGVGKTTTIGKLAYMFKSEGKKVMLGAADTFRAAAIEQLDIWGNRVGVDVIKHQTGADPAAVAYDSIQAAKSRQVDVLILDTAGRLHTKSNLMDELKKVRKVLGKEIPRAPHETLLVLDATTGQNAISQANLFNEVLQLSGIVLTKLDGTAKGGVVVGIRKTLDVPVKLIGIGERIEDLRIFDSGEFAAALFDEEETGVTE
ncbi:MAG: signal recognition particle-docking protein FtsY [Clostridiales bacterium]|nr:signal recognition particle-docking protein FtsY [Clostridiales bacterium]MCF8022597.1 signal recognition particle-docking protein FtsY [Clostridiales bacterium]